MTVPLKAARKAAGGARKSAPAARRRPPAPLPPEGTEARRQRDAVEAIKASREPEPEQLDDQLVDEQPAPAPSSLGAGGLSVPAVPAPVSAGSGFALGVVAWAFGLAYLNGGMDGVRKFAAAKFFNKG